MLSKTKHLAQDYDKSFVRHREIAFSPFGRRTSFLPTLRFVRMTP